MSVAPCRNWSATKYAEMLSVLLVQLSALGTLAIIMYIDQLSIKLRRLLIISCIIKTSLQFYLEFSEIRAYRGNCYP